MTIPTAVAFYLPQFHPIPENDEWWGPGFTEWRNVVNAKPLFAGHRQPREPADLGYYDLRSTDVQVQQAQLALSHGVGAFCYYYYWFNGVRLLERPLEQMLATPEIEIPFMICWANENWTRAWDGRDDDVLLEQRHDAESDGAFMRDLLPVLRDKRYLRLGDRPVIVVYRPERLPEPERTAELWRSISADNDIGEITLLNVQAFSETPPAELGFDAAVEFPPLNGGRGAPLAAYTPPGLGPEFAGSMHDYPATVDQAISDPVLDYRRYRTVFPRWDNTSRREHPSLFLNESPDQYERWLAHTMVESAADGAELVFINAWNEWAEGNYLEPDTYLGRAYLEATRRAVSLVEPFDDQDLKALDMRMRAAERSNRHLTDLLRSYTPVTGARLLADRWRPTIPPEVVDRDIEETGELTIETLEMSRVNGSGDELVVGVFGWAAFDDVDLSDSALRMYLALISNDLSDCRWLVVTERRERTDVANRFNKTAYRNTLMSGFGVSGRVSGLTGTVGVLAVVVTGSGEVRCALGNRLYAIGPG